MLLVSSHYIGSHLAKVKVSCPVDSCFDVGDSFLKIRLYCWGEAPIRICIFQWSVDFLELPNSRTMSNCPSFLVCFPTFSGVKQCFIKCLFPSILNKKLKRKIKPNWQIFVGKVDLFDETVECSERALLQVYRKNRDTKGVWILRLSPGNRRSYVYGSRDDFWKNTLKESKKIWLFGWKEPNFPPFGWLVSCPFDSQSNIHFSSAVKPQFEVPKVPSSFPDHGFKTVRVRHWNPGLKLWFIQGKGPSVISFFLHCSLHRPAKSPVS